MQKQRSSKKCINRTIEIIHLSVVSYFLFLFYCLDHIYSVYNSTVTVYYTLFL